MRKQINRRDWDSITHKQRETRLRALTALRLMRVGKSLTGATKESNIAPRTFRRHAGNTITKKKGKWKAKTSDRISRRMTIFTRGKMVDIKVEDSKTASVIGKYHSAVGIFRQFGNPSKLKDFERITVKDVLGNQFPLETRPTKIVQILDAIERHDVPEIYAM